MWNCKSSLVCGYSSDSILGYFYLSDFQMKRTQRTMFRSKWGVIRLMSLAWTNMVGDLDPTNGWVHEKIQHSFNFQLWEYKKTRLELVLSTVKTLFSNRAIYIQEVSVTLPPSHRVQILTLQMNNMNNVYGQKCLSLIILTRIERIYTQVLWEYEKIRQELIISTVKGALLPIPSTLIVTVLYPSQMAILWSWLFGF